MQNRANRIAELERKVRELETERDQIKREREKLREEQRSALVIDMRKELIGE